MNNFGIKIKILNFSKIIKKKLGNLEIWEITYVPEEQAVHANKALR